MNQDKIKELLQSGDLAERKLGFAMMQQLGFLKARDFTDWYCSSANYGVNHAMLLIGFEIPRCLYYGGILADYRFRRIRSNSRCPIRTKPILTYGKYDENFLKIIFANMEHYGQDITVANEKGWMLKGDSTESDWNYKVDKNNNWHRIGVNHITWDHRNHR
jgi:hypothetical protein